jgi:histidyl-tRNA synthetase
MAADTMEALGIPRGSYVVKVSNRKFIEGLMDAEGITEAKRPTVLRTIDKMDRLGVDGVRMLLGSGRKDESGDFTKGAGLNAAQIENIIEYLGTVVRGSDFSGVTKQLAAIEKSATGLSGLNEIEEMTKFFESAGYQKDQIKIDPAVVRGLEYYTGPVFEVELTFATAGKDGAARFGSVGGGGRYDGLVSRFRGEAVPATGFSVGVSRLAAALQHLGKLETRAEFGPVVVTVFDKDRLADYQAMVAKLRAADIRAELYLGNPRNLGNQLKYADRRHAPCVVIQGSDEKAKGQVTIKDLIVGAELAKLEKGRDAHLQKQAEAQRSVPESALVAAIYEVLARHGLNSK